MNEIAPGHAAAHDQLADLSAALCKRFGEASAHARSLVIAHGSLAGSAFGVQRGNDEARFGLCLELCTGSGSAGSVPRVRCATGELPFIDAAFRVVILYHVIAHGEEPELREACRVLAPGGDLVVVGLNHCGWSGFDAGAFAEVPRLHPARVRRRLRHMDMVLAGHLGAGLLGRNRPGVLEQTWQRPIVSVADVVLLHARHADRPPLIPARFKDIPVGLAPTAFAGP